MSRQSSRDKDTAGPWNGQNNADVTDGRTIFGNSRSSSQINLKNVIEQVQSLGLPIPSRLLEPGSHSQHSMVSQPLLTPNALFASWLMVEEEVVASPANHDYRHHQSTCIDPDDQHPYIRSHTSAFRAEQKVRVAQASIHSNLIWKRFTSFLIALGVPQITSGNSFPALWEDRVKGEHNQKGLLAIPNNLERDLVAWMPDCSQEHCTRCSRKWSLTLRRHHCRLCGDLICKYHTHVRLIPKHSPTSREADSNHPQSVLPAPSSPSISRQSSFASLFIGTFRRSKQGPTKNHDYCYPIKCCSDCHKIIGRYLQKEKESTHPSPPSPYLTYYQEVSKLKAEILPDLQVYNQSLFILKQRFEVVQEDEEYRKCNTLRALLIQKFALMEGKLKRFKALTDSLAKDGGSVHPHTLMIHQNLLKDTVDFMQVHMISMSWMPKPGRQQVNSVLDPYSSANRTPEISAHMQVLLEQRTILLDQIRESTEHRQFMNVRALKEALHDIDQELARI